MTKLLYNTRQKWRMDYLYMDHDILGEYFQRADRTPQNVVNLTTLYEDWPMGELATGDAYMPRVEIYRLGLIRQPGCSTEMIHSQWILYSQVLHYGREEEWGQQYMVRISGETTHRACRSSVISTNDTQKPSRGSSLSLPARFLL